MFNKTVSTTGDRNSTRSASVRSRRGDMLESQLITASYLKTLKMVPNAANSVTLQK